VAARPNWYLLEGGVNMNTTIKNGVIAGIVALVVALGIVLGAKAFPDNSRVVEGSSVTLVAPDGSVLGLTAPLRAASSGPPVPACTTLNTVLTCEGTGVPFAWNPVTIDGSVAGNVYLTTLTTTGVYASDGNAPLQTFVIPVAPAGKDASTYVGVADYNLSITERIVDAASCWTATDLNFIIANTGGFVSGGGGTAGPSSSNPGANTLSWGNDSGLDGGFAASLFGLTSDAGNMIVAVNVNGWLCPGVVADAATYATTLNYTVSYSN
jgi:hypothetical protein